MTLQHTKTDTDRVGSDQHFTLDVVILGDQSGADDQALRQAVEIIGNGSRFIEDLHSADLCVDGESKAPVGKFPSQIEQQAALTILTNKLSGKVEIEWLPG